MDVVSASAVRHSPETMLAIRCGSQFAARWIPQPGILQPYPNERFDARQPKYEPDAVTLHVRRRARVRPKGRPLPRPHHLLQRLWASARRFRTCALINSICDVRLPESFLVCSLGLLPPVKHCRKEIFLHGQIFRAADSAARTCGHTCPKLQNKTAKTIVLVFVGGFTKLLMLRNPRLQDPKTAALEIFMPALTSLPELLSKNPDQAKSLNRNERQARERATRVHLIHVTGPKEVPFDELLTE